MKYISSLCCLPMAMACAASPTMTTPPEVAPQGNQDGMSTSAPAPDAANARAPQGNLDGTEPAPPAEGSYAEARPPQGNHDGMKDTRSPLASSQSGTAGNEAAEDGASAADPNDTEVAFDVYIVKTCALDDMKLYFPYDSAKLVGAESRLKQFADCATTGALKQTILKITGHADPRGSEQYNKELGKSRAETVAGALAASGVPRDRMTVKSKGEQQASEQKSEWPTDRRVEISAELK